MSAVMPVEQLLRRLDQLTSAIVLMTKAPTNTLTRSEVCGRLRVHRNTLTAYIADIGFPAPTKNGKWLLSEIMDWEGHRESPLSDGLKPLAAQYVPIPSTEKTGFHLYRHFDSEGQLLYVGVSLNALGRLQEHRQTSHWSGSITRVDITHWRSRQDSLLAEQMAIKAEKPLFNKQHMRGQK